MRKNYWNKKKTVKNWIKAKMEIGMVFKKGILLEFIPNPLVGKTYMSTTLTLEKSRMSVFTVNYYCNNYKYLRATVELMIKLTRRTRMQY